MRITDGLNQPARLMPQQAAKAYGASPLQRPATTAASTTHDAFTLRPDRYESASPAKSLVAGSVSGSVDFSPQTIKAPLASANALQMYTRAADRVEAAVGVALGRTLDIKG
jgi:hypothetical protein